MIVSLLRGANQVSLKLALTAMPPFGAAFARMAVSAVVVGAWGRLRGAPLAPLPHEWRPLVNLTLLFVAQIGLLHLGADLTSPAFAVVLMNSNPIWANFLAHFVVPEDKLTAPRLAGLGLAFCGICAVFLGRPDASLAPSPAIGNSFVLAAALAAGIRTVYTQRLLQSIEPLKAVFWQTALSLPLFLLAAWPEAAQHREPLGWVPAVAILYQGVVVGGLSLVMWVYLLRKHSPGALSVFSFAIPIFGMLLSGLMLSEQIPPRLLAGAAAVLTGIYAASRTTGGAANGPQPSD
jgi:drug/metabolite transporter (DMT)-like permease